jgi:hypothetical protein
MKGGAAYQDWGADGQGLCGEMECFEAGDNSVMLSVGPEKVWLHRISHRIVGKWRTQGQSSGTEGDWPRFQTQDSFRAPQGSHLNKYLILPRKPGDLDTPSI